MICVYVTAFNLTDIPLGKSLLFAYTVRRLHRLGIRVRIRIKLFESITHYVNVQFVFGTLDTFGCKAAWRQVFVLVRCL